MPERKAGVTDYSKWDHIELSDDEECHPNIEKNTWRRLQREKIAQRQQERDTELEELQGKLPKLKEEVEKAGEGTAEKRKLQEELDHVEHRISRLSKIFTSDNMCKVKEERSFVNHEKTSHTADGYALPPETEKDKTFMKDGVMSEDSKVHSYQEYCDKHKELLEKFGSCKTMDETRQLLEKHGDVLLQEHSSWYFLMSCLEAEMGGERDKMKLRCRQSQVLSSITELAKTERRHPGNIIAPFFERLKSPERFSVFVQGVDDFAKRIQERAVQKRQEEAVGAAPGADLLSEGVIVEAKGLKGIPELNGVRGEVLGRRKNGRIGVAFPDPFGEKALKEENLEIIPLAQLKEEQDEREEREKDPNYCWWLPNDLPREQRLGPGGLDPVEVFKDLPQCLKDAFRSREMEPLHAAIAQLPSEEAERHLKACTDAGLWNASGGGDDEEEEDAAGKQAAEASKAVHKAAI